MKRLLSLLLCALLCLCLWPAAAESPAYADKVDESAQEVCYTGVATVALKLRKAPNKNAGSIGQIGKDDSVLILSLAEDWCKVRTTRNDGFVQTKYLSSICTYSQNGEASEPVPTPTPDPNAEATKAPKATATPKPATDPKATIAPTGNPELPQLTERGFLAPGQEEFVHIDAEDGLWIYISDTLHITIKRYTDPGRKLVWEEADILCDVDAGEVLHTVKNDTTVKAYKDYIAPFVLARRKQIVFNMSTDYYTYRAESKVKNKTTKIGVEIRGGELLYDDPVGPKRSNHTPLSMMALYPDGDLRTYLATDITATELLNQGVSDVFSFGPVLVQNHEVTQQAITSGRDTREPRIGLGIYEKGHYLAIMMEGRQGKTNQGLSMKDFAYFFQAYGVREAFALDGGQTSYLCFMGEYVNTTGSYGAGKSKPRESTELLGIGHSTLVPAYDGTDYQ